MYILTQLAYRANAKKRFISNDIVAVLKARGKRTLADVNCYCKMTSVVPLDGITSFLRLKDATYACKRMDTVQLLAGFLPCNGGKLEKLKTSNVFPSFIVC